MSIWLPLITNLVITIILCTGIIVGVKRGFRCELIKLLFLLGAGVGCYFLTPILSNLVLKIQFINEFATMLDFSINSIVFMLEILICYLLISIIINNISKCIVVGRKNYNKAKRVKLKGLSRKDTKELRRQEKLFRKQQLQNVYRTFKSRLFGAIFGFIIALVLGFVLMLPVNVTFKKVAEVQPKLEQITKGYEYTIYGQLDKITNISDKIIKE